MKKPVKRAAKVVDRDDDMMAKGGKVAPPMGKMPKPPKGGGVMIMIGMKPKKK